MNNIDFIITTMDRYALLEQLLDSIFKFYPEAKVTIADQSKEIDSEFYNKYYDNNIRILPLPHDCGISVARNTLVKETTGKYKLLLEDDFLFTEDTKIEKLLDLMRVSDIAGGGVYKNNIRIPFEFCFKRSGDTIYQVPDGNNWENCGGINYKKTGCVLNFFLAKSIVFDDILWYDKLKVIEHQHFFYRCTHKIAFTNDVKILDNKKQNSADYKKLRCREYFWKDALENLGVKKLRYLSGQTVEVDGNKIKRYRTTL